MAVDVYHCGCHHLRTRCNQYYVHVSFRSDPSRRLHLRHSDRVSVHFKQLQLYAIKAIHIYSSDNATAVVRGRGRANTAQPSGTDDNLYQPSPFGFEPFTPWTGCRIVNRQGLVPASGNASTSFTLTVNPARIDLVRGRNYYIAAVAIDGNYNYTITPFTIVNNA